GCDTVLDERPAAAPERPSRPVRIRSDVKTSRQTRERFRDFIRATAIAPTAIAHEPVWRRALAWLRAGGGNHGSKHPRAGLADVRKALEGSLPEGIELRRYADRTPIEGELPRARVAFEIGRASCRERVEVSVVGGKASKRQRS